MMRYFLRSKSTHNEFQERTNEIFSLTPVSNGSHVSIRFTSDPSKSYEYNRENVAKVEERSLPIDSDKLYFCGTRTIVNPKSAKKLTSDNREFSTRIEIYDENGVHLYKADELIAHNKARTSGLFRYLHKIANVLEDATSSDNDSKYLSKQFDRLAEQTLAGSAVAPLVDETAAETPSLGEEPIIYPFGLNLSQMEAVDTALTHGLSIIEGPPGTGKTQTILNILANIVIRKQTALVTSPNNAATRNVEEKLEKEGFGFLVAALGRKSNIDDFVANQDEKAYPSSLLSWQRTEGEKTELRARIDQQTDILKRILTYEQELIREEMHLKTLEMEFAYFPNPAEQIHCAKRVGIKQLFKIRNSVIECGKRGRSIPFFQKLIFLFAWGVGEWRDYRTISADLELKLNALIVDKALDETHAKIRKYERFLGEYARTAVSASIIADSKELFCAALYERYASRLRSSRRTFDNPWSEPAEFRIEYPIITSTTNAARNQIGKHRRIFDYVVIDESSQANLVTGFLALSAAKYGVVVGDVNQLPCVISATDSQKAQTVSKEHIPEFFDYTTYSLLAALKECAANITFKIPCTLLKEHYRCHPDIIGFCNEQFYDGKLLIMTGKSNSKTPALTCLMSAEGYHDRTKDHNRVQAEMFAQECLPHFEQNHNLEDIGVAVPFRRQVKGMTALASISAAVEIKTVHKYQGREKAALAFLTVANERSEFVDDPRLINVAVSRAKDEFFLITSPAMIKGEGNIPDLYRYISYRKGEMINSRVLPAFPFLYPNQNHKRKEYLSLRGAPDDEYSEVQAEEYLLLVLAELDPRGRLSYCRNYLLKLLAWNLLDLTPEEQRFIDRSSHADFIIFRTIDHAPILEIEVNGSQHDTDAIQIKRDQTKKTILDKMQIPQLIIRTNEEQSALLANLRDALRTALAKNEGDCSQLSANPFVVVTTPDQPWDASTDDLH